MSDKEEKSLDVFGLKSYGDAINTIAKGLIDGIGAFLGKICLPAAEEFGLLLRDKISYYRIVNLAKVTEKAKKKIEESGRTESGSMNPRILKEIIEESSWTEDEGLQEMWAGLLAGTAVDRNPNDDALIYINVLKKLSAFQANLLNLIYGDPRICSFPSSFSILNFEFKPRVPLVYTSKQILRISPRPLNEVVPITGATHERILNDTSCHDIALGRFQPQMLGLKSESLILEFKTVEFNGLGVQFWPTISGLDLYMRCTGVSIYPIEAYIITRQEKYKREGISPFTWMPSN